MDNRPIGFFDSGLGGLTSIPYLMNRLPEEKVIYFGDTARTPYGSKAVTTIRRFSAEIADFLVKCNVKMIVIACNTVSATCVDDLRKRFPEIPVVGIIQPSAEEVASFCPTDTRIGIIGTKVTIASHAYRSYIENLRSENNIRRIYPELNIINPSSIVVVRIQEILTERDMLASGSDFTNVFYASDLSENFINMIDHIFADVDEDKKVKFMNFDLEKERINGL